MKKMLAICLAMLLVMVAPMTAFATTTIPNLNVGESGNIGADEYMVSNYGSVGTVDSTGELGTNQEMSGLSATVGTNNGKISTNDGEVTTNNGKIGYLEAGWEAYGGNNGTVTTNNGTIYTSKGDVGLNNGTIGYAYASNAFSGASYGTVTENKGSVISNHGTIVDNNGTVTINSSIVGYSAKIITNSGTVKTNAGTIKTNKGVIEINSSTGGYVGNNTGTINGNYGTVENNTGTILDNHKLVKVNGLGGVVNINSGEGYENASVQTNYGTVVVSGCSNMALTYGEADGIATLTFADTNEYISSDPTGVQVTIKTLEEANMTTPEGQEFVNWKDYLSNTVYAPGSTIAMTTALNLVAVWQAITPEQEVTTTTTYSKPSVSYTSIPTSEGSFSEPVVGEWYSKDGTYQYKVKGQSLINTIACISYEKDGKTVAGIFYFDKFGNMQTGWQKIADVWYYFDPTTGAMLIDTTTPDGYKVDAEGKYVK